MKKLSLLLLLVGALLITVSSCTKDEISTDHTTNPPIVTQDDHFNSLLDNVDSRSDEDALDLGCFSIDVPFSLDIDGTIVDVSTFEDFESALVFDSSQIAINVDFVYPLHITYTDGTTADIADGEALGEAFAQCIPDEGWDQDSLAVGGDDFPAFLICELNSCYTMVYPVSLQGEEDVLHTVSSEDELIDLLAEEPFLSFVFPISLITTDGVEVAAGSDDELFDLLLSCDGDPGVIDPEWPDSLDVDVNFGGFGCYDFVFPLDVSDLDGSITTLENENDFNVALLNGNVASLVFPLTLAHIETGETIEVADDNALFEAMLLCGGDIVEPPVFENEAFFFFISSSDIDGECYEINYPVSAIGLDSIQITFQNGEELLESFAVDIIPHTLVYPVSVNMLLDGQTITLDGAEDVFALIANCPE